MPAPHVQILVVDDDPDFTQSMALLLELAGYRTAQAYDGDSAFELALQCRPLVVLTDLAMPRRDGYRLLASLRAEPSCRDVFAVALSGWGGRDTAERARGAGFDAHFMKPCEHAELMNTLANAVAARSLQQQAAGCRGAAGGGGTGW
jgi:CheY-like chemotaxis protein